MPENDKGRVRIMSIHKSKGLEYPIVILAGLGKKFNFQDSISKLVMHAKSGIGLDAVNLQTRKKMTSAYKEIYCGPTESGNAGRGAEDFICGYDQSQGKIDYDRHGEPEKIPTKSLKSGRETVEFWVKFFLTGC